MVSVVTAATAAATIKKPLVAEDDFESQQKRNVRQPEVCVDYLSYTFDEMDLAASWRVMTKQKKDVVDGIRLENASWRTWAKQRNNLKTISPQTLNWLKDSDVTWLYGPLHTVIRTEEDPFLTPRKATTEETLGLMIAHKEKVKEEKKPLKSALKKVTTTDLLKRSASELLHQQQQPTLIQNRKQHRKISISDVNNELLAVSPVVLANHRQPRLRFNHQVEQCIALTDEEEREHEDIIEEEEEEEEEEEHLMEEDASEEDEDTDQIITSYITYHPHNTSNSRYQQQQQPRKSIIKKIAPARLKKSQSDADTDDISSISSTSTASSFGVITRSPVVSVVSSPVTRHLYISDSEEEQEEESDSDEGEEDENGIKTSFYERPTPGQQHQQQIQQQIRPAPVRSNTSSSNSIITQTKIAEPALVTTHSTATDIQSSNGKNTLFNNIATWAASYLWPADNNGRRGRPSSMPPQSSPSPQPSVSASIIPSISSAIPIERPYYAPPTSSNHSSL